MKHLVSATSPPFSLDRNAYEKYGWQHIQELFSGDDLIELQVEASRLCANQSSFGRRGIVPNSERRSDRLDPVIDLSPRFRLLSKSPKLIGHAKELVGGPVQLMKDKFIAKPPGASGYGVHQDFAYWQGLDLNPDKVLTAVIFLNDATRLNGAIEVASCMHRELLTKEGEVADPDEGQIREWTLVEAKAGDVLFFHSLTPHRSGPNQSDLSRRCLLLTYAGDERVDLYGHYQRHDDRYQ